MWRGLSVTHCGMPHVPVHNADNLCLDRGQTTRWKRRPLIIVAQVYNLGNFHWVLCLLLIAPTRGYLYLKFDPPV